jgi:hypothetical protein
VRFHFPSFALGFGAGAATVLLGRELRPVLVEMASAVYGLADALAARVAMFHEDAEDVLAEARARARRPRPRGARARARA